MPSAEAIGHPRDVNVREKSAYDPAALEALRSRLIPALGGADRRVLREARPPGEQGLDGIPPYQVMGEKTFARSSPSYGAIHAHGGELARA